MKLIDKDAVVAKIEKLDNYWHLSKNAGGQAFVENLFSFLDTLEMKEVDINKEISQFINTNFEKATIGHKLSLRRIAKHFFELGLRSTITEEDVKLIWNIGDDLPYMPEEEFFKELLKRYKAQKGEKV